MYRPKHFEPYELVTPEIYEHLLTSSKIYSLFDEKALRTLDLLREWAGVGLTVNNWYWNGSRQYSGLRPVNCPVGAKFSTHKIGKAFDVISPKLTAQQLWRILEAHSSELPCPIRIEKTANGKQCTWLHFDTKVADGQASIIQYFNA